MYTKRGEWVGKREPFCHLPSVILLNCTCASNHFCLLTSLLFIAAWAKVDHLDVAWPSLREEDVLLLKRRSKLSKNSPISIVPVQYSDAPQGGAQSAKLFWVILAKQSSTAVQFWLLHYVSISRILFFLSYDAGQYRFEVAVDYLLPVQHLQAPQKCMSETPDKGEAEALEVVFFYELVQVHPRWRKNVWRLVISSRWRHIKKLRLAERFHENTLSMSKCTQCGFTYKKMLLK